MRSLTEDELSSSFELPEFVKWEDRFAVEIVPIQLFRSVLDSVIHRISPQTSDPAKKRRFESVPDDSVVAPDGVWLSDLNLWLPGSWAEAQITDKAVKSDDAEVDCRPWHRRISLLFPCSTAHLKTIESFLTRRWRRNVIRSFFDFMTFHHGPGWRLAASSKRPFSFSSESPELKRLKSGHGTRGETKVSDKGGVAAAPRGDFLDRVPIIGRNFDHGMRCIGQILLSYWWEWTNGSSPMFWRWNRKEQIAAVRDGMPIYVSSPLPRSHRKTKVPRFDSESRPLVAAKIDSMISKSYLEVGKVKTFLHYFAVAKGDSDIRVVFDSTSCGLN